MPNDSRGADPWAPYIPTPEAPWDLRRVVHLHRRGGFAAAWDVLRRDLADGPGPSVDRLLSGRVGGGMRPEEFGRIADPLGATAREAGRLKGWWIYRMLFGPDPLGERLALMWHDHFATSLDKVRDVAAMRRQNETFRRLARAPFGELLGAVARDPALLVWLDAPSNHKGRPNENLARELMELFTLGIGNYDERDVQEAARALTGWTVAEGSFREAPADHDDGEKSILGRRGRWDGGDLVRMLLEHPATATRLAGRVCGLLMGEGTADEDAVAALARGLHAHDLDVGWAVGTVLRSQAFFAEPNLGSRMAGPAEFVVGAARALELTAPPPSTMGLAEWSARMGQDLFYPPNVGGWPGGRSWISPPTLIGRANYAAALLAGELARGGTAPDILGLAARHGRGDSIEAVITFASELWLGAEPAPAFRARLVAALGPRQKVTPESARRAVALVLASPEAQSC